MQRTAVLQNPDCVVSAEIMALLREVGIEPEAFLQRQAELAAWRRSSEEEAQLAAERAALKEALEAHNRLVAEHGAMREHLEAE